MWVLLALVQMLADALRSREGLVLENLALRQQLAMYLEKRPQPRPGSLDRAFWVALSRCWSDWASALVVFKPETVVRWHRQGFRLFWRLLSWWRARPDVRSVPKDVRARARRKVLHFGVTEHPHTEWIVQQLRGAFGFLETVPRYLIFDRDSTFGARVREVVRQFGMKPKQTSFRSPWQNGICERWIGSFRRDVLDHVVVLGEEHLLRLARENIAYYHEDRTHLGLGKDTPIPRPVDHRPSPYAAVVGEPRIGGLHHRYRWEKAA